MQHKKIEKYARHRYIFFENIRREIRCLNISKHFFIAQDTRPWLPETRAEMGPLSFLFHISLTPGLFELISVAVTKHHNKNQFRVHLA